MDTYQAPIYREKHVKMMQDRITQVENQFGELCQIFGSLERKLSKMRDTGDKLAKAVADYSSYERFNASTKASLKDFSVAYAAIQDFRDVEVKRLEAKVIQPLSNYGELCKKTRESLKKASTALTKEMKQRKSLETAREKNPSNTQQLSHVNMQVEKAAQDSTMRTKQVELEMDQFEKKKLADMKKILIDFVNMEMIFHAKSLEWYTEAHNSLSMINEDEDLEEFRTLMRQSSLGGGSVSSRPPLAQRSQSMGSRLSVSSAGTDVGLSSNGRNSQTTPTGTRRLPSADSTPRQVEELTSRDDEDEEEEENEDEAESGSEEDSDDVQDDDDEDNSDDDYARQLSSGQRPSSASAAAGSRSSQGHQASPGKSSTMPQSANTPTKSILRPKSPKV